MKSNILIEAKTRFGKNIVRENGSLYKFIKRMGEFNEKSCVIKIKSLDTEKEIIVKLEKDADYVVKLNMI